MLIKPPDVYDVFLITPSLNEDERMFETKVSIKVLGYLIGDGPNRDKPQITIRENAVEVKISRERVIVGDKAPWKKKDKDYDMRDNKNPFNKWHPPF